MGLQIPFGKPCITWRLLENPPCSMGNTSSIRVDFPACHVSLPECFTTPPERNSIQNATTHPFPQNEKVVNEGAGHVLIHSLGIRFPLTNVCEPPERDEMNEKIQFRTKIEDPFLETLLKMNIFC